MTDDVIKQGGYVVVGTGGGGGSVDSRGYSVLGAGGAGMLSVQKASAVIANSAIVPAINTQALLANTASVLSTTAYTLLADNSEATSHLAYGYALIHPFYPPYEDLSVDFSFMEQRFSECVSFGSQGGPGFRTNVFEFDSGFTTAEVDWERIRARYEVNFENATPEDVEEVEAFFYGMKGKAIAFRFKDWSDYQISNQNVAVGDGSSNTFQVFKRYTSGGHIFDRIIKKTVSGTMSLYLDGVELLEGSDFFMVNSEGQIVFSAPLPTGSVAEIRYAEFDVPVRFDTDYLNVSYVDFKQLNFNVPLIEVLV